MQMCVQNLHKFKNIKQIQSKKQKRMCIYVQVPNQNDIIKHRHAVV